jgi:hypothetical protein
MTIISHVNKYSTMIWITYLRNWVQIVYALRTRYRVLKKFYGIFYTQVYVRVLYSPTSLIILTVFHIPTHSFSLVNYHFKNIPYFYPFILHCQLSSEQYTTFLNIHSPLSITILTKFHISTHSFSPANYHLNNIPHFCTFIPPCQLQSEQYSTFLRIHSHLSIII